MPSRSPTPSQSATDADGRRVRVQQIPSGEVTYSPTRSLLQCHCPGPWATAGTGSTSPTLRGGDGEPSREPATATGDGVLANGLIRASVDTDTGDSTNW